MNAIDPSSVEPVVVTTQVLDQPQPPDWVLRLLGANPLQNLGESVEMVRADPLVLLRSAVPNARELDTVSFRTEVEASYAAVLAGLRRLHTFPLRFWNYVPTIGARAENGLSFYENFNAARYSAFRKWYGTSNFSRVAAASAVGTRGPDFVVHALAGPRPGTPVDNPRQIQPRRYSRHYGPFPPLFCRALRIDPSPRAAAGLPGAIVSGTASIVGEVTRHVDDLDAQLSETALNLSSVAAALLGRSRHLSSGPTLDWTSESVLARYCALRVYVPCERDESAVGRWARRVFPHLEHVEFMRADLCRPGQLVEAEGAVECDL